MLDKLYVKSSKMEDKPIDFGSIILLAIQSLFMIVFDH